MYNYSAYNIIRIVLRLRWVSVCNWMEYALITILEMWIWGEPIIRHLKNIHIVRVTLYIHPYVIMFYSSHKGVGSRVTEIMRIYLIGECRAAGIYLLMFARYASIIVVVKKLRGHSAWDCYCVEISCDGHGIIYRTNLWSTLHSCWHRCSCCLRKVSMETGNLQNHLLLGSKLVW